MPPLSSDLAVQFATASVEASNIVVQMVTRQANNQQALETLRNSLGIPEQAMPALASCLPSAAQAYRTDLIANRQDVLEPGEELSLAHVEAPLSVMSTAMVCCPLVMPTHVRACMACA